MRDLSHLISNLLLLLSLSLTYYQIIISLSMVTFGVKIDIL